MSNSPGNLQGNHHLDKNLLRKAFNDAAETYDEVAVLQREVGSRMQERLDLIRLAPDLILDVGAGTGQSSAALAARYKGARVIAFDLALNMLRQARRRVPLLDKWFNKRQGFVCGDAESLPFGAGSVDMVFSSLTLQWCNDLDGAFNEFRRVLKPGGLLMFSTFGPDTLKELRRSWAAVDDFNHVNAFIDMHDIGDALLRVGLTESVMDVEHFTLTYTDVAELMHDLKKLGAHNVTAGRPAGLTGKGRLKSLAEAYETYRNAGVLSASYEVVYGHAWGAKNTGRQRTEPGVTRIPVSHVGRPPKSL